MSRTVCHSDSTLPKGRVETVRRLKGVAGLLRGRIGREGLSKVPGRARGPTVQADVPGCLDRAKAPSQVGEAIRCHDGAMALDVGRDWQEAGGDGPSKVNRCGP